MTREQRRDRRALSIMIIAALILALPLAVFGMSLPRQDCASTAAGCSTAAPQTSRQKMLAERK